MHLSTVAIADERMTEMPEQFDSKPKPIMRLRYAFAFQVEGDLKFISHQDTLRMFKRAIARAELPVAYSEGFNPQPRVSIPLPRPVGIASICEQLVVSMSQALDLDKAVAQFQSQAPSGLTVTDGRLLSPGQRLIPCGVTYVMRLNENDTADFEGQIVNILGADEIVVTRVKAKKSEVTSVNIRPFIDHISIERNSLVIRLHVTDRGTAKPSEIAELLGYDAFSINHRIQRMKIAWLEQTPHTGST